MIIKTQTERFEHKNQIVLEILPLCMVYIAQGTQTTVAFGGFDNDDCFRAFIAKEKEIMTCFSLPFPKISLCTLRQKIMFLSWYGIVAACCMCKIKLREDKALLVFARQSFTRCLSFYGTSDDLYYLAAAASRKNLHA